jgi:aromatic-L-amino-acid decarboxylase
MTSPLRLPVEQMRDLGYRTVDEIVNHLVTLRDRPVGKPPDTTLLTALFDQQLPHLESDPVVVMRQTVRDIVATTVHTDHPRFFAYVPGPSNYIGAVADFIAAGLNVFAGNGLVGGGPAVVERITVDWLRELCGMPGTAGGLLVSGGTMANLVAIHAARVHAAATGNSTVYITDHTHRSIRKGLRFLGFVDSQVRSVPLDGQRRMDIEALSQVVSEDRAASLGPFCVLATAGTTDTGAVDQLDALADFCAREDLWLHVDAAYGAGAVLSDRARRLLSGMERADSVALDPHKWWFQPYEVGCVLVRHVNHLVDAYAMDAGYLRETRDLGVPLNFYDLGPQLTRSFRALKLWMSIRTFGLDAFRRAVEHGIELGEHAEHLLTRNPKWHVVSPAQLAILTFRPHLPDLSTNDVDQVTRRIAAATLKDGHAMVTTTELEGRPVLRLCITHPETTRADVDTTIALLDRLLAESLERSASSSSG